jgi:hypothetical protein
MTEFILGLLVGTALGALMLVFPIYEEGFEAGKRRILLEAFERGHIVHCPGYVGLHWECEP